MTGRKGRLVRSGEGGTGVVYEARNASGVDAGEGLTRVLTALSQHAQAYTLLHKTHVAHLPAFTLSLCHPRCQ